MKKTRNRILSLLLALVMTASLLPRTALAAAPAFGSFFENIPATVTNGSGTTAWSVRDVNGEYVLASPAGKSYSTCAITFRFNQGAQVHFEYKVSCRSTYDYLIIEHNGADLATPKSTYSGEVDWTGYDIAVQSGDTLILGYKKGGSASSGDDRAYLRNFSAGDPFTITFHDGCATDSQSIFGSGTLKANPFTKDRAVFKGWAVKENGPVIYTDGESITLEADMDLYAVWADTYVVTFNDNGAQTQVNVEQGTAIGGLLPAPPTRTGYIFDSWMHNGEAITAKTVITEDMTCTAAWAPISYTIRLEPNGGTGEAVNVSAVYDKDVILPSNTFTRSGYNFLGWSASSNSVSATYADGATVRNLKNTQDAVQPLYAVWTGRPVQVTIDLGYETEGRVTARTCVVGSNYNYIYAESTGGKQYSTLADPKREGYNFKGWYTQAEGGERYTSSTVFADETPVTLYARWAQAVTVTFDANGGSCSTKSKAIDKGTAYGTLPTASRSGHSFDGWYTAAEGGEKVDSSTVFEQDATLYAHFTPYYYVLKFNANGGEGGMDSVTWDSGVAYTLPKNTFTRKGYIFKEWNTVASPSSWNKGTTYADEGEYSKTISSSYSNGTTVNLYAQWEEGPETVQPPAAGSVELKEAVAALGDWYKMYPAYGTDTNVNNMLTRDLAAKGFEGIDVTVKAVEEVYGNAGIAGSGEITYFYVDPNTTPAIRMGSYKVTFTLTKDEAALDYGPVSVIVYWDADRVKNTMRREILDMVNIGDAPVTADLSLPRTVNGKKWTLISWTSSDESAISISDQNQSTAGTLFDPYVGVVKQGTEEQTVTLTAAFTFQLTNDVNGGEAPIVLYKTFTVVVPPLGGTEADAIRQGLLAKLDHGFAAKGLTDAVTGERLTAGEGRYYTAVHDIQFPTTRDFGVDGKYYPVTITSGDAEVIKAPDVKNAARVEVYRPGVGRADGQAAVTVTIADRDTGVTASKTFTIKVPALTQAEVDEELALMERVKAAYFEGIKGNNTAKDNVRTDLAPFQEVYADEHGGLVWVRDVKDRVGHGIVPAPIDGWEDLELWRLFKSSNPNVISHENLLVTRQSEAKAVIVTSYLSSETLGRYGELYQKDRVRYAQYAGLEGLYYQKVSTGATAQPKERTAATLSAPAVMVVRGTRDPDSTVPVVQTVGVSFTLTGLDGDAWIPAAAFTGLNEASTVYDVFTRALTDKGYTVTRQKGTYIVSISGPQGTLAEKEYGVNSGWMYRVNGKIPNVYMGACPIHDGDRIQVFYTRDASVDDPGWSWPSGGSSGNTAGGTSGSASGGSSGNTTGGSFGGVSGGTAARPEQIRVEKDESTGTYTVTLPESSGLRTVTIPGAKAGQLAVVVYPGGREEVIRKSAMDGDKMMLQLTESAQVKLVDYANPFSDVDSGAWYVSAVDFAAGRGLFDGVGGDSFAPGLTLSRGMLAAVLYRLEEPETLAGENLFADVPAGSWYTRSVAWAAETGIVTGYGNGAFGPEDNITREQLSTMLFRYAKLLDMRTGGRDDLTAFSDNTLVSGWAKDAVAWAVDSGILGGYPNGTLSPSGTATRAEAAVMLRRFVEFLLK